MELTRDEIKALGKLANSTTLALIADEEAGLAVDDCKVLGLLSLCRKLKTFYKVAYGGMGLTKRELRVLRQLAEGKGATDEELALYSALSVKLQAMVSAMEVDPYAIE